MRKLNDVDTSSTSQARKALLIACLLCTAGSGLGVFAIASGKVSGGESVLVVSGGLFGIGVLFTLLVCRQVAVQTIATTSTVFYAIYLCSGILISLLSAASHDDLFVYLLWFFTLLVYNKMVNVPAVGRFLARFILITPLLVIGGLFPTLLGQFPRESVYLALVFCLSYLCFGLMLDAVTRYREAYIVEREHAESLRINSEVLESISDCFIALDSDFRLVYLNDAACAEFDVHRCSALNSIVPKAVPCFFSPPMMDQLRIAFQRLAATAFEAQDTKDVWYEMRCFPQRGRMSIYFRNINEAVLSRRQLQVAHNRLREQSELLDKAQDAIFVQDMDHRILYWNQGAERLFGWKANEVMGLFTGDVFKGSIEDIRRATSCILEDGEWTGELAKRRRDGRHLIVQSRCTLVRDDNGYPHSILAINTDITARKAADAKIHNLAFHDVLTGLPNRTLFRERLETALAAAHGEQSRGALFLIDLDDFKTLNDTSGHDMGDRLLQEVALRLRSCIRECDTAARFGGDEFVVLLEGLSADLETAVAEAKSIGEIIVRAFRRPYVLQRQEYQGTASIGATLFQGSEDSVDELLKRADLAMYRAKAQGRNNLCLFDPAMEQEAASRVALLADLKRALPNGELALHYQPQVNNERRVVGCEALLRWRHPQRGMVSPSLFIPLAEADGLIVELGYWVIETACSQLSSWARKPGLQQLDMAVNVSIRQFLDARFVQRIERVLRETGADPKRLKLEITESFMMDKVDDVIAKMSALKAHGIGFSMDDFGTGYSSLSQLKRLPLDQLKIDRSFVRDVLSGVMDASIVRTIITLGRSLNLTVIAEGVETAGQRDFLQENGCYTYQGYHFSAALPASDFETFAKEFIAGRKKTQSEMSSAGLPAWRAGINRFAR